jgi:hypothetical protein
VAAAFLIKRADDHLVCTPPQALSASPKRGPRFARHLSEIGSADVRDLAGGGRSEGISPGNGIHHNESFGMDGKAL